MLPKLLSNICPGGRMNGVRFFSSLYSRNTSVCGCKFSLPLVQRSHLMESTRDKVCAIYTGKYFVIGIRGFSSNVHALHMKKRPQRKKKALTEDAEPHSGFWSVTAYATAEEYDLEKLEEGLRQQNLYAPFFVMNNGDESSKSGGSDVLRAKAKYQFDDEPREIFFFREGSVVLWNVSELECTNILNFLRKFEENSYSEALVSDECETMKYTYSDQIKKACLQDEEIILNSLDEVGLEKYTFSNAVGLSVKLGVLEASLDLYIDSIRFVTEDLRQGKHVRISREEVLRKIGQLFALRHMINLSSDLLDTPDFYWDREDLENLYHKMCLYFSIAKRTRVMNEKLNHCMELAELLSSHLNDRHHIRLEWMIIILIMVEVLFEIVHYAERILGYSQEEVATQLSQMATQPV